MFFEYSSHLIGSVIALGCWADLQDRSFRRMESSDPLLYDSFESRADPIGTCAKVATKMKIKYFAMQKGGQCFVAKDKDNVTFNRYSPSRKCKYGLGGPMANDVYMLKLSKLLFLTFSFISFSGFFKVYFCTVLNNLYTGQLFSLLHRFTFMCQLFVLIFTS